MMLLCLLVTFHLGNNFPNVNRSIRAMLEQEMETSSTLRAEIEELKLVNVARQEKDLSKLHALQKYAHSLYCCTQYMLQRNSANMPKVMVQREYSFRTGLATCVSLRSLCFTTVES